MTTIDAAQLFTQPDFNPTQRSGRDPAQFSMRGRVIWGVIFAVALLGGVGAWAATARLSGAVIGHGSVKVDQDLKVVQHVDGGVVRQIGVRVGDRVTIGQVLLRLDGTQAEAEHSILAGQIVEQEARRLRLVAERDDLSSLAVPEAFGADSLARMAIQEEAQLFATNLDYRTSQLEQMKLQKTQLEQEITGLQSQRSANTSQLELATADRDRLRELAASQLVETSRLSATEAEAMRLQGMIGEADAAIARAQSRISELQLRILSTDSDRRTVAQRELRTVDALIAELKERYRAAQARLGRVDIVAPASGIINELNVTTLGGVISPAERLLTIVPDDADLTIEFRVAVTDIDQVTVGKAATLRFSAFNQRVTPEAEGVVTRVAAAAQLDQATGQSFYAADIALVDDTMTPTDLVPGMPVEVFVETEQQVAIAYFLKPFTDQVTRSFREE